MSLSFKEMAAIDESLVQVREESNTDNHSRPLNQITSESNPLVQTQRSVDSGCVPFKLKFRSAICLKSKSAVLILIWSFLAHSLQYIYFDPYLTTTTFNRLFRHHYNVNFIYIVGFTYVYLTVVSLFYPLAGLLADVRYGRYRCVMCSQWIFIGGSLLIGISAALGASLHFVLQKHHIWSHETLAIVLIFIGIPIIIGLFLFFVSIIAFHANVIQFGLDQLRDSPTDYLVMYIRWFMLVSYSGAVIAKVLTNYLCCYDRILLILLAAILVCFYCFLLLSLCVGFYKCHNWFLTDPGFRNPYTLVYKVIRFSLKHKNPIHRSAFTYCEDELPSRLDLGKEKYGGPFTTEQVENVKVFLGILQLMISLGPFLAIERSTYTLLPKFSDHLSTNFTTQNTIFSFHSIDAIHSLIVILIYGFYVIALRPFIHDYIPRMLTRMRFGMMLMTTPVLCLLIIDIIGHTEVSREHPLNINPLFLFIPFLTGSCGYMMFYIALFEFICAQSPHSMKGLLIGTFYAIRGIFQLLGVLLFIFPFLGWRLSSSFPSCGFAYYLVIIIVAIFGLILFTRMAKRYQYRQRDEPDKIYQYAEEYYEHRDESNSNSEYDTYDTLTMHSD